MCSECDLLFLVTPALHNSPRYHKMHINYTKAMQKLYKTLNLYAKIVQINISYGNVEKILIKFLHTYTNKV